MAIGDRVFVALLLLNCRLSEFTRHLARNRRCIAVDSGSRSGQLGLVDLPRWRWRRRGGRRRVRPSAHQIKVRESGVDKEPLIAPAAGSVLKSFLRHLAPPTTTPHRPPSSTPPFPTAAAAAVFVNVSDCGRYQPPNCHFLSADTTRTKGRSGRGGCWGGGVGVGKSNSQRTRARSE